MNLVRLPFHAFALLWRNLVVKYASVHNMSDYACGEHRRQGASLLTELAVR